MVDFGFDLLVAVYLFIAFWIIVDGLMQDWMEMTTAERTWELGQLLGILWIWRLIVVDMFKIAGGF